jgi:hypothetical protein
MSVPGVRCPNCTRMSGMILNPTELAPVRYARCFHCTYVWPTLEDTVGTAGHRRRWAPAASGGSGVAVSPIGPCCAIGDVTVMVVATGVVVGRVIRGRTGGRWWERVGSFGSREEALQEARRLARLNEVHAWFRMTDETCERIALDGEGLPPPSGG